MKELIFLLNCAFGNEVEGVGIPLSSCPSVVNVAIEQGVAALVNDGIQYLYENHSEFTDIFERDKSIKYDLFGQSLMVEQEYAEQWRYAKKFAKSLDEYGIRVIVLKGFALSCLYPVPEHRPCSDLDCYLVRGQSPAYKAGNDIAAELGYSVNTDYYKHSKIRVGSLMVENHLLCLPIKGDSRSKKLNKFLLSIIDDGELSFIGDSKLLSPSPMFNAIYLLAHAREHFFNEGITLRHICDWAMRFGISGRSLAGNLDC